MTIEQVIKFLEELRNAKDFESIKIIRDRCRELVAISNKDWFED